MNIEAKAMTLDEPADERYKVPRVLLLARIYVNVLDGRVLEESKALSVLRRLLQCNLSHFLDRWLRRFKVHNRYDCNQK